MDWRALLAQFPDADLTVTCYRWLPPFDAFAKGAPWWQWREPCDCEDTSFGRNPHRWDCVLTPIWEQTIRDLDVNPWTVARGSLLWTQMPATWFDRVFAANANLNAEEHINNAK